MFTLKHKTFIGLLLLPCMAMAAVQGVMQETPAEKTARTELDNAISKFPAAALPQIVLKYDAALGGEEYRICRSSNGDVIISGGRPRGVLYGALEFMERFMGIRFCSLDYTYIPASLPSALPGTIDLSGKPAFTSRNYYDISSQNRSWEKFRRFHAFSRMNAAGELPEYGFSESVGLPRGCHTFMYYALDLPQQYCWVNPQGRRVQVKNTAGGQICYSLPEVKEHMLKKLKAYIAEDRAKCDQTGAPYPTVYDISANDCNALCFCKPCKDFAAKHNVSGLVLNFINQLACEIVKTYPEIKIQTFAYKDTMLPPKGNIKAADNVIVNSAFMDVEFGAGAHNRDVLRPLNNPQQKWFREQLQAWSKAAKHLAIWDYWKLYYEAFANPKGAIRDRAEYIKMYQQLGVDRIFIEAEIDDDKSMVSFTDLRSYQAAKLMWDPTLDSKALIADYMQAFYGAAAPVMIEYLDFLEESMARETSPLGWVDVRNRAYCTPEFFSTAHQLLDKAEQLAAGDQARLNHIAQERLIVDIAEASIKGALAPGQGERIRKAYMAYIQKYFAASYYSQMAKNKCDQLLGGFNRPALPERFVVMRAKEASWPDWQRTIADPAAAGGRCISLARELERLKKPNTPDFHKKNLLFGVYDRKNKKNIAMCDIPKDKLPQDEKFHLYYLGCAVLNDESGLWAHASWNLGADMRALADRHMPDRPGEIYVSLKVQGPSYVKGSTQIDDVRIDRIIYVPWEPELIRKALPKLPEEMNAGTDFREMAYCDFTGYVYDADAAGGQTLALSGKLKRKQGVDPHKHDLQMGIYDPATREAVGLKAVVVPKAQLPQDEKFHYYFVGRGKLTESCVLWGHQSWALGYALKKLFDAKSPDTLSDVYVSLKVQGPSYVKGSSKSDDIMLDRIIAVPVKSESTQAPFVPGALVK